MNEPARPVTLSPPEGENRCIHCGKDLPTEAGLTQHLRRDGLFDAIGQHPLDDRATNSDEAEGGKSDAGRDGGVFGPDYGDGGQAQGENEDKGEEGEDDEDEDDEDDDKTEDGSKANTDSDDDANDDYLEEDSQSAENNPDLMDLHQSPPPPDAQSDRMVEDENDEVVLVEIVDQHGQRVYIEEYPCPTAGEPMRRDTTANRDRSNYPDVGELKSPDCFEIAQLLLESGVSARMRNRFLHLKRVSTICLKYL
ncbi:hypothetical protein FRC10_006904 [Ceratobasidium sp. 414]|nr:hypothetical protein FRC10_006904 [Ceratobasidium sp. 414]